MTTMTYPVDMTPELHAALQATADALSDRLNEHGGRDEDWAALAAATALLIEIEAIG